MSVEDIDAELVVPNPVFLKDFVQKKKNLIENAFYVFISKMSDQEYVINLIFSLLILKISNDALPIATHATLLDVSFSFTWVSEFCNVQSKVIVGEELIWIVPVPSDKHVLSNIYAIM